MIEDIDYIICKICKKKVKKISLHVLRIHNITCIQYQSMFPNAKLSCKEVIERQANTYVKNHGYKRYIDKFINKKEIEDYVVCKICNKKYSNLVGHLRRTHNLSKIEYLEKFPYAQILSKKSKDNIENNYRVRKENHPLIRQKEVEKRLSFENGKEDIDYVVCRICSFKGHNLDRHIKKAHKISLEEYKKMFPKALIYYKRYQIQNILKKDKKFEILFLRTGVSYTQYKAGYNEKWTKELREEVRKRDNYTCQLCGDIKPKDGSVHHIDYDKKNSVLDNLIYLCKSCHTKVESVFFAFGWTFYFQEVLKSKRSE